MGDSWLAMEACLRLEPSIIHRVVLTTGYRFFDYLKSLPKSIISIISAQRYNRYNFPIPSTQSHQNIANLLQNSKNPHFSPHIFVYMNFFRTFAAGFLVRAHIHIRTHKIHRAQTARNAKVKQWNYKNCR